MNKADLIEALAPRLGSRAAATAAVEAIADVVMREVAAGGSVGISGFGTFEGVERAPRTGRNPRTGEAVPIEATTSPRFRPGAYFKDVVADPSRLPREGLAGVRVAGDGRAQPASGSPVSVRREAQPRPPAEQPPLAPTARPRKVSGMPATVRAVPGGSDSPSTGPGLQVPPAGRVMSGGEEITMKMISAKKAQLAKAKDDQVTGGAKAAKKKGKKKKSKKKIS